MNKDTSMVAESGSATGVPSFVLIGVTIYLLIIILPEIIYGQIYVQ